MISRQIDTRKRRTPVPLSFLICTANDFDCDIYIESDSGHINVKNYDEMLRDLRTRDKFLLFLFDGIDEQAAGRKIQWILEE